MKQKKPSKPVANWFIVLIYMFLGAIYGYFSIRYLNSISAMELSSGAYLLLLLLLMVCLYAAMFFQILLHEAGHLVFGLLTGYQFSSFRIGSLMWLREEDGRLCLRRLSLAGTAGQCLMNPPEWKDGDMPFVLYNLGGAILNLISVPIFAGLYFLCKGILYLPMLFLSMGLVGFAFALLNGIPLRLGVVDNDGYNTKMLCQSPQARKSFWIQLKITEQTAKGVRLKDMPQTWFYLPETSELSNSMVAVMAVFYENRLMDQHRFAEAGQLIDQLFSVETGIVGLHRSLLTCDRIYCELLSQRDRQVLTRLGAEKQMPPMKQLQTYPSVLRTAFAYALLLQESASKAQQIQRQFDRCAKAYPYPADIESERELMDLAQQLHTV